MSDLLDYDKTRKCAKCGSGAVSTRFVPAIGSTDEILRRQRLGITTKDEMMQRQCQDCGYYWAERPLG